MIATTIMTTFEKKFTMLDGRITNCIVNDTHIILKTGLFTGKYKHSESKEFFHLHAKIFSEKSLKEMQKFINESREPEQLSLF